MRKIKYYVSHSMYQNYGTPLNKGIPDDLGLFMKN